MSETYGKNGGEMKQELIADRAHLGSQESSAVVDEGSTTSQRCVATMISTTDESPAIALFLTEVGGRTRWSTEG